jgi:hypothetical protein
MKIPSELSNDQNKMTLNKCWKFVKSVISSIISEDSFKILHCLFCRDLTIAPVLNY